MRLSINQVTTSMSLTPDESIELTKATLAFFPPEYHDREQLIVIGINHTRNLARRFLHKHGKTFFSKSIAGRPRWNVSRQEDRTLIANIEQIMIRQVENKRHTLRKSEHRMSRKTQNSRTHGSTPFEDQDYEPSVVAAGSRAGSLPTTRANTQPGMPMLPSVEEVSETEQSAFSTPSGSSSSSGRSTPCADDTSSSHTVPDWQESSQADSLAGPNPRSITLAPSELSTGTERDRLRAARHARTLRTDVRPTAESASTTALGNLVSRRKSLEPHSQPSSSTLRVELPCIPRAANIARPVSVERQPSIISGFSDIDFDGLFCPNEGKAEDENVLQTLTPQESGRFPTPHPLREGCCQATPPGSATSSSIFGGPAAQAESDSKPPLGNGNERIIDLTEVEEYQLYLGGGITRAVPKDQGVRKMQCIFGTIEEEVKKYNDMTQNESLTINERSFAKQRADSIRGMLQKLLKSERIWAGTRIIEPNPNEYPG